MAEKKDGGFAATEGQRITTRYFGGYESVKVIEVFQHAYTVSRFGGQAVDILPKDKVSKVFDEDGNELFCSETEKGIHPAAAALLSHREAKP